MGTVIARTAAADDIVRDAKTTHEQGVARGGRTREIVEIRLGTLLPLVTSIGSEHAPLVEQIVSLRASRDAAIERASATVSECSDVLWNRIGRPANDPRFDLIFPGGASAYTGGPMDGMADRIAVLIDLLGRGLHPQLTTELVTEWSGKLETARAQVTAASTALVTPIARETVLERSYYSVVKRVQAALASVKRDLKSEGMTEAQIHEIIPDRPRATAKPVPASDPTPSPTPITPAPSPATA